MSIAYQRIEVFTSEEARHKGGALYKAVIQHVRDRKIAARCLVLRGVAGCYENGEVATQGIEVLSFNLPLKIEIVLPAVEVPNVLPGIEEIVTDGVVAVSDLPVRRHATPSRYLPRQLRVRDAMTSAPARATAQTPVSEVLRQLLRAEFNGMPVVDDLGRPVGIVTQGDLIRRAGVPVRKGLLQDCAAGELPALMAELAGKTAREIMSSPVATIREDQSVAKAVDVMVARKLKRLPVVDAEGRLVGMLARYDIFKIIGHETPDWRNLHRSVQISDVRAIRDIMDPHPQTVAPDAPIEEVIRIIDTSEIQRVSVVDGTGRFLGLISDKAVLAAFGNQRPGLWAYLCRRLPFTDLGKHHREYVSLLKGRTAADVMKKDAVVVREDALVDEAIRLMVAKSIKRLPVLDRDGKLKGMVSRDAVLRLGVSDGLS